MTRLSLVISDETNRSLRRFLGQKGSKKGDLSKFVEDAVKTRIFELTVKHVQNRNTQYDQQDIMDTVDDAVKWVRENRS